MTVNGAPTSDVTEAATGQTQTSFQAGEVTVNLHSSWLGFSDESTEVIELIRKDLEHELGVEEYMEAGSSAFLNQETRFFVVKGSRKLVGDMLKKKLFDLETGEELEVADLMHDQLYRVLEKAVLDAAEKRDTEFTERETREFMNAIFDAREEAIQGEELFKELETSTNKIRQMIVDLDVEEEEVEA